MDTKITIHNTIQHELAHRPLAAIDLILQTLSETTSDTTLLSLEELLSLFSQALLQYLKKAVEEISPPKELFTKELSQQERYFIGICLLRLLATCDRCFEVGEWGRRTFELFDDVFSDDLYPPLKLTKKEQTYLKQRKLKDIVPSIEKLLSSVIFSLTTLDELSYLTYRRAVMEAFLNKRARSFVWPFLPPGNLEVKLSSVFHALENYLKAPETEILDAFEKAQNILDEYQREAEAYGTTYSTLYLVTIIKHLLALLGNHFQQNPMSKPARVIALPQEKKYPFTQVGNHLDLGIKVSNQGPGHAFDVILKADSNIALNEPEIYLGHFDPQFSAEIELPAQVTEAVTRGEVFIILNWTNFDKTSGMSEFLFEFEGQRPDIDWESLKEKNPYDLEPVTTEQDLVGRTETLNKLLTQAQAKYVGSCYIFGQKRVGKTSISKTLKTRLQDAHPDDYQVVYLEAGDYVQPEAITTIAHLGRRLCQEIQRGNSFFASLDIPIFDGAFSSFSDFLADVNQLAPDYRILFVLDEFDELPAELYRKGSPGDAFFLTLRSISSKAPFGFILVGGEKMEYIMHYQGGVLNKFAPVRVDYFDREHHWPDFKELVQRPVAPYIEITDAALTHIYEHTAGNPYFTKIICSELFDLLVERRDGHATPKEVMEATHHALSTIASNSFQHFWEDGILDISDTRIEERMAQRRKFLVAFAETLDTNVCAQKSAIVEHARRYGLTEYDVQVEIQDFVRRQILVEHEGQSYTCKIPFFGAWLKAHGIREMITTFENPELFLKQKQEEDEAYVQANELVTLVKHHEWYYKGQHIAEERIRTWLSQFGKNRDQRLAFHILEHLHFYDRSLIRAKLQEAHRMVVSGLTRYNEPGKRKRDDILVSYIDGPGKSGALYARLYADEAEILHSNVVERGKLKQALKRTQQHSFPQVLVFIDDFLGTGDSSAKCCKMLAQECGELLRTPSLRRIFFITLCGFVDGKTHLEQTIEELGLPITVRVCDLLDDADRCLNEQSRVFPNRKEREEAQHLLYTIGLRLGMEEPFGYKNSQAMVVFESSCPNNTLPLLWFDARGWIPLFKR